ncbi:MAG: hypothetical protein IPP83_19415 [Flavobacteriales bacterium]|nr:hypothetical protein [Flavobacteriales bacterium]
MTTKELREKVQQAIENIPDKALVKLIELLEELRIVPVDEQSDDALIERIINENRDVLSRLAK